MVRKYLGKRNRTNPLERRPQSEKAISGASQSKVTPSGSFSSDQVSAVPAFANTLGLSVLCHGRLRIALAASK
jgi:hypothetical protein